MTVVRERRQQKALRLSLPPPIPSPPEHPQWIDIPPTNSPDIDTLSDLQKLSVLGHGSGGIVYKVRHRQSGSIYALKVIRFNYDGADAFLRRQAFCEAEILKLIDSPFIVKCHAIFETSVTADLCFVMEHMAGGSLADALSRRRRRLDEDVISAIAWRVLRGLQYLHRINIVHGDIKPSNLLIDGEGHVKIADFGVSKVVRASRPGTEFILMGTCAYMSPERVDPESWAGEEANGFPGDVWAVGVVVFECLIGRYPLIEIGERADWAALMWAICFGETVELPEDASPELRDFVSRCMEKDWRKRASLEELLAHPFLNTAANLIQRPPLNN